MRWVARAAAIVVMLMCSVAVGQQTGRSAEFDLSVVKAIPVQHDGRVMPLDTLARDVVEKVTGRSFLGGRDPVWWLLGWTIEPSRWRTEPLMSVRNAELRRELDLPADRTIFSYAELMGHARLQTLLQDVAHMSGGRKPDPLQAKVREIGDRLSTLREVFRGQVIRLIPDADDRLAAWETIDSIGEEADGAAGEARAAYSALEQAWKAGEVDAFDAAASRLAGALAGLPAADRAQGARLATELRYNRLHPFRIAWMVMSVGAVLALAALLGRRRWLDGVAVVAMLAGFATLSYGLSLRWAIAGRIPAANMFESLLFLSWGMGAFAIVSILLLRDRLVPFTASVMGALALFLADVLPLDHYIRPITPVLLDTIWMSIHVPVIMVSYSVLALAMLIAHAQLVVMAVMPARRRLAEAVDGLHYWYLHVGCVLLGGGIVTGSMWAASSWGRYWGWDPKEVWSLIAFAAYLAILHVRGPRERLPGWVYGVGVGLAVAVLVIVVPTLAPLTFMTVLALAGAVAAGILFLLGRGPFAVALKSIVAFWLIIMTYVGVNFILGIGLHSYGFGTGAVVRYLFLTSGLDLAFILLCTAVYLARRPASAAPVAVAASLPQAQGGSLPNQ
ncbi:MAG: cytochrome c biogenesis protein CcsA [Phycisphaerae bacterium]|nr:cytochrome c biogenesis protein CcsA [Phycisphaerae bacterium]